MIREEDVDLVEKEGILEITRGKGISITTTKEMKHQNQET